MSDLEKTCFDCDRKPMRVMGPLIQHAEYTRDNQIRIDSVYLFQCPKCKRVDVGKTEELRRLKHE